MLYFGLSHQEIGYQVAGLINDYNYLSQKRNVYDILSGRVSYIIETHGRYVIGAIGVDRQSYTFTEIKHLVVRPEWRQKGIGQFLVRRAMELVDSRMVYCTIREDNKPSLKMFEKLGFHKAGKYSAGDHQVVILAKVAPKWLEKRPGLESSFVSEESLPTKALKPTSDASSSDPSTDFLPPK